MVALGDVGLNAMVSAARSLYGDFVRTFGNVLFAVSLFVMWGLLTLVGVIVQQGEDPSLYFQSYAAPIARAILRLNFDNIYHSPWYVGIIGLILLSLAVCTFKRVVPARLPPLRPVTIDKIPLHDSFDVDQDAPAVRTRLSELLSARGWRVRERVFGGTEWSFGDRHNWARWGVLVAHTGFVIIAAGTTLYWARGFSGELAVLTGQTQQIAQTHALIRLDGFAYKIAPFCPSELVAEAFELARAAREVDMRASPYDLRGYGFAPIAIETRPGREEYVEHQRCLAALAQPIRERILEVYRHLRAARFGK